MDRVSTSSSHALARALAALERGGILLLPTDTVYGIGCDSRNTEAVQKIFRLKKRDLLKQIALLVASIEMADSIARIDHDVYRGLTRLWPGAFTGLFTSKMGQEKVGIRIPNDTFVLTLIERFRRPIAVTSANISGEKTPSRLEDVIRVFDEGAIDCVVDGGDLPDSMASTVVDFTVRPFRIVREGPVEKSLLEDVFRAPFQ